ncbi:hypothetical protein [Nocardia sp. NPDC059239]|uniref:hypothetical protein n=1 Tax=unclassified Nocardia TaxID=2637762 RepID=UPI0036BF9342
MGHSPSADLYWGYDLGDMTDHDTWESLAPRWWQESGDWKDELARRLGWEHAELPDDYPARSDHQDLSFIDWRVFVTEYEQNSEAYQVYAANRNHRAALLASVPVELDQYGYSEGDPTWAVRVKASVQRVSDWGSIQLAPLELAPEWSEHLARFIEVLELQVPDGGPAWHMNCSYG